MCSHVLSDYKAVISVFIVILLLLLLLRRKLVEKEQTVSSMSLPTEYEILGFPRSFSTELSCAVAPETLGPNTVYILSQNGEIFYAQICHTLSLLCHFVILLTCLTDLLPILICMKICLKVSANYLYLRRFTTK
ncbi:hypothetical protein AB6A40_000901 [Gnathostoma spinigerum]|uniref:Uncharacterized protein n=1 Tax=Gnathostoma spinigerum TaxID=75299 RepID=A0ABD6EBX8_9BILA